MVEIENKLTEAQVRELRDIVYGIPITDKGWLVCKKEWMKPMEIKWLQEQVNKQTKK